MFGWRRVVHIFSNLSKALDEEREVTVAGEWVAR
jgi:hypothetical protein